MKPLQYSFRPAESTITYLLIFPFWRSIATAANNRFCFYNLCKKIFSSSGQTSGTRTSQSSSVQGERRNFILCFSQFLYEEHWRLDLLFLFLLYRVCLNFFPSVKQEASELKPDSVLCLYGQFWWRMLDNLDRLFTYQTVQIMC